MLDKITKETALSKLSATPTIEEAFKKCSSYKFILGASELKSDEGETFRPSVR